ncbi:MAG: transposase, partial [Bacillota bacterium]|nr:transposase [Bacillota bacterium]
MNAPSADSRNATANLSSATGRELSARRRIDTESVFGRLKANWSFRRFLLRGLEKVSTEWG